MAITTPLVYYWNRVSAAEQFRAQQLCERRGGGHGFQSFLMVGTVSEDVKHHWTNAGYSFSCSPDLSLSCCCLGQDSLKKIGIEMSAILNGADDKSDNTLDRKIN